MPTLDISTLVNIRRTLNYEPGARAEPTFLDDDKKISSGFSRAIASHHFTPTTEEFELAMGDLELTFTGPPNGGAGTYVYHDVPLSEYIDFTQAASLGSYFNDYIKDKYDFERIS